MNSEPKKTVQPSEKEFECDVCGHVFNRKFNRDRHVELIHKVPRPEKPSLYLKEESKDRPEVQVSEKEDKTKEVGVIKVDEEEEDEEEEELEEVEKVEETEEPPSKKPKRRYQKRRLCTLEFPLFDCETFQFRVYPLYSICDMK